MFTTIDHVAIHCSDAERSAAFYQRCFGFTRLSAHERPQGTIIYLGLGNAVLELTEKPAKPCPGCISPLPRRTWMPPSFILPPRVFVRHRNPAS